MDSIPGSPPPSPPGSPGGSPRSQRSPDKVWVLNASPGRFARTAKLAMQAKKWSSKPKPTETTVEDIIESQLADAETTVAKASKEATATPRSLFGGGQVRAENTALLARCDSLTKELQGAKEALAEGAAARKAAERVAVAKLAAERVARARAAKASEEDEAVAAEAAAAAAKAKAAADAALSKLEVERAARLVAASAADETTRRLSLQKAISSKEAAARAAELAARQQAKQKAALVLQSSFKTHVVRKTFASTRAACERIQGTWKRRLAARSRVIKKRLMLLVLVVALVQVAAAVYWIRSMTHADEADDGVALVDDVDKVQWISIAGRPVMPKLVLWIGSATAPLLAIVKVVAAQSAARAAAVKLAATAVGSSVPGVGPAVALGSLGSGASALLLRRTAAKVAASALPAAQVGLKFGAMSPFVAAVGSVIGLGTSILL